MKVVLAFDKFKGSATAQQLNEAAQQSLCGLDHVTATCVPVADGGDGTTAALAATRHGQWITMDVPAPLLHLNPVHASYFLCDDGTALIETAAASGLALVPPGARDVMHATSLGTGLMMRDAMERGSRHIVLGLGGSATCDAGMGIMSALGAEFLDRHDHYLFPSGASLEHIVRIEVRGIPAEVHDTRFTLLTDVDNPLCGQYGTAAIYGPQKGAAPQQVEQLERGMQRVAAIAGQDIACRAGCGAAGGIPALMLHLLDCELVPGAPYILDANGLQDTLTDADLVITGEGCLDRQTLMGKAPGHIINLARENGIPVIAICGVIAPDISLTAIGLTAAIAVSDGLTIEQAMDTAGTLMRVSAAVRQAVTKVADSFD